MYFRSGKKFEIHLASGQVNFSFHFPHLKITCPTGTQCLISKVVRYMYCLTKCIRLLALNAASDKSNCWTGGVTQRSKSAPGFYIDSCFQLIILCHSCCSHQFWIISFCLEIIVYQVDTFRQTDRTTEANFNCPTGHQTSIFTCPRSNFTCPGQ